MPSVVHYEIPADDVERARKFYGDIFGWKIEDAQGMEYWLIESKGEHGINGGMMKRQAPEQCITIYMEVDSVDEYSKKIQANGGKVVMPKTPVPGMGWFAIALDTENNAFGIWQDDKNAK